MSVDANQMYVGAKPTNEAVTEDARNDEGRLKSSGMNRDRSDKNPVSDEFDFASQRGQLGQKGNAPVTDEARLEQAKAATGIQPGTAKFSNQMFVGAKPTSEAVTEDARNDEGRLKSSGMNRDRNDKNPVRDEFNFADLRAGLGKKKNAGGNQQPSVTSGGASQPPVQPSPTIVPPTPEKGMSRAGSTNSMRPPQTPTKSPTASAASPQKQASRAGTPVQSPSVASPSVANAPSQRGSVPPSPQAAADASPPAASISRQSSLRSTGGQPTAAPAASAPRSNGSVAAASDAGQQPTISRQASLQSQGAAPSHHSLSRQPSQASQASRHSRASAAPAPFSPASTQQPPPQAAPQVQEVSHASADLQQTVDQLKAQVSQLETKLSAKETELKNEKAGTKSKVADLERRLQEALAAPKHRSSSGQCQMCQQLQEELVKERSKVQKLEGKLKDKERTVSDLQQSVNRPSGVQQHVVDNLQKELATLRQAGDSREHLIRQLTIQLESAHEAILASAHKGFEFDIKLHQARATLVSMLKKERNSPRRTASPTGTASPQRYQYSSPTATSPPRQQGYQSIKTPSSPHTQLR